jgi:AcrR family transcriptional regulator
MPSATKSRPRTRRSDEAILDAAETLFARHGPDGVSFRQIASAAGSANHFAVQYHFKDKQGLIQAIFERRLRSLEVRRGALLDTLLQDGRESDARSLLEALILPLAEERDTAGRRSYAAFLLGMCVFGHIDQRWGGSEQSAPISLRINALLRDLLPSLPPELYTDRLFAATMVFLSAAVECDRRLGGTTTDHAEANFLSCALDFSVAGMMAAYTGSISPMPSPPWVQR